MTSIIHPTQYAALREYAASTRPPPTYRTIVIGPLPLGPAKGPNRAQRRAEARAKW
jgi:hypothetical protein